MFPAGRGEDREVEGNRDVGGNSEVGDREVGERRGATLRWTSRPSNVHQRTKPTENVDQSYKKSDSSYFIQQV